MTAPHVRADYDQLNQIETRFEQERENLHQTLATLRQHKEQLQGGGWQGRAARVFYGEMDGDLMPALARLESALGQAARITSHIRVRIQLAEADAARVLRADSPSPVATVPGPMNEAGPAFIALPRSPSPRVIRQAMARRRAAAEAAAVDRLLSIFDPQVRALARQSPTLRAQLVTLQKKGIMFLTGPRSQTIEPFITIHQDLSGPEAVAMIAHEVGHVISNDQEIQMIEETPTMTRDEYVERNTVNNLRNEALAQFNALQVRAELLKAGAGDIGVPGHGDAGFAQVYARYAAGQLTRDQAVDQMGSLMGNLVRESGPPTKTYRDYAVEHFRNDWDTHIAPLRPPQK